MSPAILYGVVPFISAILGVIVGVVFATLKIDKRLCLIEVAISGRGGIMDRFDNLELAINARKTPQQKDC